MKPSRRDVSLRMLLWPVVYLLNGLTWLAWGIAMIPIAISCLCIAAADRLETHAGLPYRIPPPDMEDV